MKIPRLSEELFTKINVPADGSCLFWAVTLAYLTPVRYDNDVFQARFKNLFGEGELEKVEQVQGLIQAYSPLLDSRLVHNDKIFKKLVTEKFRNRVIDNISSQENKFKESIIVNDFLYSKREKYVTDGNFLGKFRNEFRVEINQYNIDVNKFKPSKLDEVAIQAIDKELDKIPDRDKAKKFKLRAYLECMSDPQAWGGDHEIQAISQVLHCDIHVFFKGVPHTINYDGSNTQIQLFNNGEVHYNFGLIKASVLLEAIKDNKQQEAKTYLNLGIDDINYKDSDSWILLYFAARGGNEEIIKLLLNNLQMPSNQPVSQLKFSDQQKDQLLQNVVGKDIDHKAFYTVIRLSNTELLETLIGRRLSDYNNNPDTKQRLDDLLSKAYEQLKVTNVPLSPEMEFFVEDKLIELRFFTENNVQNHQEVRASYKGVMQRIDMVLEHINKLQQEYGETSKEVDGEFILTARFIAQNIHVLKRQLKSTYNKLPWEEIEFCVASFIASSTKRQDSSFIYQSVLDKARLLQHLKNFAGELDKQKPNIKRTDIDSKFPKPVERVQLSARNNAVELVLSNNPSFQDLYNDYEKVKVVYSLKRIESYIKVALSVDLNREQELGKLVIERTLQIIGESLKNSLESPNVSDDVHRFLLSSAPRGLREIITALRDSLSHSYTLTKKIEFENNKDLKFFQDIQNDLKKIEKEIGYVLYKRKVAAIRVLLEKIIKSEDRAEVKELIASFDRARLGEIDLADNHPQELDRTKELITELKNEIKNPTEEQQDLFSKIDKIISSQEARLSSEKVSYMDKFRVVNNMIDRTSYIDDLATIKSMIRTLLPHVEQSQVKDSNFKQLASLVAQIQNSINGIKLSEQNLDITKIQELVYKTFFTVKFEAGSIKGIEQFKTRLEEKEPNNESKIQREVDSILDDVQSKITDNFRAELTKRKGIYAAKLELANLFTKLSKGVVVEYKSIQQQYDRLVKQLERTQKQKQKLDQKFNNNEWSECQKLIDKVRNSYQTLLNSIKNAVENERFDDVSKSFKEFIKTITKSQDLPDNLLDTVIDSKEQLQRYFNQRLETLKQLLPAHSNKPNAKLLIAVEMLMLDLTEIIEHASLLADNRLFFESYSPVFIGKSLRNYLAHGDLLIDTLLDSTEEIISNALQLIKTVGKSSFITQGNKLIGQKTVEDLAILREYYNQDIGLVTKVNSMFQAVKKGKIDDLKRYIKDGVDVKARAINGWTGLHFATQGNNVEMLQFFLQQGLNINTRDLYGQTLLEIAIKFKSNDVFKYIIEDFSSDKTIDTLLLIAAQDGNKEVVEMLLDKGARIDAATKDDNRTSLHLAAQNGHREVVEVLLANKAKIDAETNGNSTPLHYAAAMGHKEVVKILLAKGAKVGDTTLYSAAGLGHKDVVEMLLANGANVDAAVNEDNATPLLWAAQNGHKDVVEVLLAYGANVDAVGGEYNRTPLNYAAQNGHKELAELLLANGAKVDAVDKRDNATPLHYAALNGHKDVVEVLLANGADVDAVDKDNATPLLWAAQNGYKDVVEVLLKKKAKVDAVDKKDNATPLHCAAQNGHKDVVEVLLANRANVDATTRDNRTPLHYAAQNGHKDVVKTLLEGKANVDAVNKDNVTPLHYAAQDGHKEVVETLLERGAKIDAITENNRTPLHYAAQNDHKEVIEALLEKEANVNAVDKDNWTPLHLAARHGHHNIVEALLEKKANVDAVDKDNATPLHYAVRNGHKEVVKTLLERGANVNVVAIVEVKTLLEGKANVVTKDNMTPLHLAAQNGHREMVKTLLERGAKIDAITENNRTPLHYAAQNDHREVVKTLLEGKANVNAATKDNATPLHYAAQSGYKEVVKTLLEGGANVNAATKDNATPLHYAARSGYKEVVETLLAKEANVNGVDKDNWTPLHLAVQNGYKEVVEMLLYKGANVDAVTKDNATPLHYAVRNGHKEVVKTLLERGANVDAVAIGDITPLHLVAQNGHKKVVETLLEGRAKIDAATKDNATPLHYAVQNGHKEVVEALLEGGANVDATTEDNRTPLHYAARNGHKEVVEVLLANEARIDAVTEDNVTPLHLAAFDGHKEVVELLLEKEANVNAVTKDNWTPLHLATTNNHLEIVKLLIDNSADANIKNKNGETPLDLALKKQAAMDPEIIALLMSIIIMPSPLHYAAQDGKEDEVKALLQERANVDAVAIGDITPLHLAAQNGHKKVVETLLEGRAKIDAATKDNATPLHYAVQNGHKEVVETLLEGGANVDATTEDNRTPLHYAARNGHKEVVEVLLANEARIDAVTGDNVTPLHLAAFDGHKEVVELLLEKEANVNAVTKDNWTPLHLATTNNHLEIVKLLIDNSADANIKNKNGETPLDLALKKQAAMDPEIIALLMSIIIMPSPLHYAAQDGKEDEVKALLQERANVDAVAIGDITPLHLAAQNGHKKVVETLLEGRAKIDAATKDNATPLHYAVQNGHKEVVETLLEGGANVDATTEDNRTPLHYAARNGHKEVVEVLLANEARIDAVTGDNVTPLHLAAFDGHKEVVELLLEKEANVNAVTKDNWTPLHLTTTNNHLEIVKLLIDNSADANIKNKNGETPLDLALKKQAAMNPEIIALLMSITIMPSPLHYAAQDGKEDEVKALLQERANVNAVDSESATPLHYATRKGHEKIVKILLESGAKIDVLDKDNRTPLHLAALNGHGAVVETLLAKRITVINVADKDKNKALHFAAQYSYTEIVKALLQKGADNNGKNKDGMTALHWAAKNGHLEVLQLLIEHKANANIKDNNNKTPLDLAQEHSAQQTVEQDKFDTIKALLMSVTNESDLQLERLFNDIVVNVY